MLISRKSAAALLSNGQHQVCHNMRGLFMLVKHFASVQQVQWLAAHMMVIIPCFADFTWILWTAIHPTSFRMRAPKSVYRNTPVTLSVSPPETPDTRQMAGHQSHDSSIAAIS